ncbi:hypothetical protein ZWY2020_036073 [Hordeum vulgare]|nr:hypothetical protein ZWY2020_036073 [Hordeum vulgare]
MRPPRRLRHRAPAAPLAVRRTPRAVLRAARRTPLAAALAELLLTSAPSRDSSGSASSPPPLPPPSRRHGSHGGARVQQQSGAESASSSHPRTARLRLQTPMFELRIDEPVDIEVDVIHVVARQQPAWRGLQEGHGGGGGLIIADTGRVEVLVPDADGARIGDGLGDNRDLVEAYSAPSLDGPYEFGIAFVSTQVFLVITLGILLLALAVAYLLVYLSSFVYPSPSFSS